VRLFVKGIQRPLVTESDGSDELSPLIFGYADLGLIGIEEIAKRLRGSFRHTKIVPGALLPVKRPETESLTYIPPRQRVPAVHTRINVIRLPLDLNEKANLIVIPMPRKILWRMQIQGLIIDVM
jgi:hypothetical protein